MPRMSLHCNQNNCIYERELEVSDADLGENFVKTGTVNSEEHTFLEEKKHHVDEFNLLNYDHGQFLVEIDGHQIGLLEVTRDKFARPYFYLGRERL